MSQVWITFTLFYIPVFVVVVNCRTPPAIHFGKHSWQGTTYGEQATYECDKGYKLIGVSTIVCQADGKWSDSPTCEIPPGKALRLWFFS